jgi:hypothetical protein
MTKQTNQAPSIKHGQDTFVVKVASYFESKAVAEAKFTVAASGYSFAQWQKHIIYKCRLAFDSQGLQLPKSRDAFEVRFASLEDAETALKGLKPEVRQYVKATTLTPVFGIL